MPGCDTCCPSSRATAATLCFAQPFCRLLAGSCPREQPRHQPKLSSDVPEGCDVPSTDGTCNGKSCCSPAVEQGHGLPGGHRVIAHFVRFSCPSLMAVPLRIRRRCSCPWACRFCCVRKSEGFLLWNNVEREKVVQEAPSGSWPCDGVIHSSSTRCHRGRFLWSRVSDRGTTTGIEGNVITPVTSKVTVMPV